MGTKALVYLFSFFVSFLILGKSYYNYYSLDQELSETVKTRDSSLDSSREELKKIKRELALYNEKTKHYQITEHEAQEKLKRDLNPLTKIGLGYKIISAQRDQKYQNIIYVNFELFSKTKMWLNFYNDIYPVTFKRMKIINYYNYNDTKIEAMAVYYAI